MGEYEYSLSIQSPPDELFSFVADVRNVTRFVPMIGGADSPSHGRVRIWGQADGRPYDADGYVLADDDLRLVEWGLDGHLSYRGWIRVVGPDGAPVSRLTIHLSLLPVPGRPRDLDDLDDGRDPARDAEIRGVLERAVHSIQHLVEGRAARLEHQVLV